jgi:arginine decarboxylase
LIEGEPYYLGFMLVGAYQDTMGDLHNLFGRVNEVEVLQTDAGDEVRRIQPGEPASEVLRWFGFDADDLIERIEHGLKQVVEDRRMLPDEASSLLDDYRERLSRYTYLD